jgi:hypothetical protein
MNESWFDDPAVITADVVFIQTKGKHMSSLHAAFCCEKIGAQPARLMLDVGDWPDCNRLGTLGDLHSPKELRELRFYAQDQII